MDDGKDYKNLLEKLEYCVIDGCYYWKQQPVASVQAWEKAGSLTSKGYRTISYKNKNYKEHILVWVMLTGSLPEGQIDHINRIKTDNHMENLRDVDNFTNCMNKPPKGTSKLRGVYFCKQTGKWSAETSFGGKKRRLGRFKTEEDAHKAWLLATSH